MINFDNMIGFIYAELSIPLRFSSSSVKKIIAGTAMGIVMIAPNDNSRIYL